MTSKEPAVISPFDKLPDEIWLRIFSELPVETICLCRVVSKKWYYLSQDETLWQHYSSLLFKPGPLPPRTRSTLNSWENFYRLQLNRQRGIATRAFNFKAHDKVIALKLRGNILVTGTNDGYLGVWNIKTCKLEKEINVGADIICVDFIEHKNVIACGSYYGDFGCKLFSLSTGAVLGRFTEDHWIGTQCMDMNDEYIILGTYRGIIHVLLWEDGRKTALFHLHTNRVAGVRLLGKDTAMSVSANGAIDIFNITTNELLYQYILPRTSVNICAFDKNIDGRDVLCIAPNGAIFHIRWEDVPSTDEKEEERIRKIFSKDPRIIYQNNDVPYRLYCAGIDSKYNNIVIGLLVVPFPPRGHLLTYNPRTNAESNKRSEIRGFNKIRTNNGMLPPTSDNKPLTHDNTNVVFSVLDIDEERVVAGCTRGWIYCFEFSVDQEEREGKKETNEIKREDEDIINEESLIEDLYEDVFNGKKMEIKQKNEGKKETNEIKREDEDITDKESLTEELYEEVFNVETKQENEIAIKKICMWDL